MAAKKNESKKSENKKMSSQANVKSGLKPEIISIITIGVCILIIISVFSGNGRNNTDFSENAIGFLGGVVCWILKGALGIGAYVLPFGIIVLSSAAFFSENHKIKLSKFIMGTVLFLILISFTHLLGESAVKSPIECFNDGGAFNGGFVGCVVGNALYSVFGFGTYIIFVILAIILAVLITGKSFMIMMRNCYWKIKDSFEKDSLKYTRNSGKKNYNDDYDDYDDYDNYDDEPESGFDEKKNLKMSKKWAGSTEKSNAQRKKNYQGKQIVRHNGKVISITIPERSEKSGKNKISLFTDELKKYKKKPSMPSFLSKNNVMFEKPEDDISDDDMFEENFIIRGFVSDDRKNGGVEPNPLAEPNPPADNNFGYDNFSGQKDDYFDYKEPPKKESIFDSEEFQEKIRENFKERFRNNIEYNNRKERESDVISNEEEEVLDADNCMEVSDERQIDDDEEIASADFENNLEKDEKLIDEPILEDSQQEEENNIYTEDTYNDDFYYPNEGFISDELETDENLKQAVSDYFNGDIGMPFKPEEFEEKSDYKQIEENAKAEKEVKIENNIEKDVSFEKKYKFTEKQPIKKEKYDEPKIIQAEKQTIVNGNRAQEEVPKKEYVFPPTSFLNRNPVVPSQSSREEIIENSRILVRTLKSFNIEAKVNEISKGPTVTRYELSPGEGIKVSKILGLADNLALSLAAKSIRIEAPIPGKAAVGIEIPNKEVTSVYLSEVVCDKVFQDFPSKLAFGLGKDITGNVIVADIAKMPHMLVAGRTGSGKSVCINTLITSILYKSTPDEVKLIMIDPKVVELSVYNGIPHLLIPVVTDPQKAAGALNWAVSEMMVRYDLMASTGVRDLKGYNEYCKENGLPKVPQIIIIIDELADLMMVASKDVEAAICRLAQLARAAGLHLIIATQRPSVDVITGLIKANIPSRIAFAVSSTTDSRTILDMGGADKLLGMGDMLFKSVSVDSDKPLRIQGAFVSDKEVEKIVSFIKENNPVVYDEGLIEKITSASSESKGGGGDGDSDSSDELIDQAIEFVVRKGSASGSMLQRKFKIGYNRAARIIEELEERGIIGPETGTSKPRTVLMNRYEYEDYMERRRDYI